GPQWLSLAIQFDAYCGAVRKCAGLADTDFNPLYFGKLAKQPFDHTFYQGLKQIDVRLGALLHDGFAQQAVVQDGVDVLVMNRLANLDVELGVDVQGLGGAKFVLENADAGVQRQLRKKYASCGHDVVLRSCA